MNLHTLLLTFLTLLNHFSGFSADNAFLDVCQLIINQGYPCEEHHVITSDGYILALHRIQHGREIISSSSKVVFLQHGLLGSSAEFVITGPNHGLAFLLADKGYDVWMGNTRGNIYSRNHTQISPDSAEFWQFDWNEMGSFDLPTMISFALETTEQPSLFYIGHGQGTTAFYVMVTENPEYNQKITAHFSMAPMAFMNHVNSPFFKFLSRVPTPSDAIGENEFHVDETLMAYFVESCDDANIPKEFCNNTMFWILGFPNNVDPDSVSLISQCTPSGSSRQILHYLQEIVSGKFRNYDFGMDNFAHYGSFQPPDYKLNVTTAPVYLFYSYNDNVVGEIDVIRLCNELGNSCEGKFVVSDPSFNHMDFIFDIKAPELVYNKIIAIMARYTYNKIV